METEVSISEVKKITSKTSFCNDGDQYEQEWWPFFKERFPNCENFWRQFVVPSTNRIVQGSTDRISHRSNVSDDIINITLFHYSMFMNLVYAYNHLLNFTLSSFDDFYTHIASACDLAEEFLLKVYLLVIECQNQKSNILQNLSKKDFLGLCDKWYDDKYPKVYENYLEKGKFASIKIPNRKNVLDEYFNDSKDWKKYKKFVQKIREYRNVIIHNVQIGRILIRGNVILVPKKEKIHDYRKLYSVFAAKQNVKKLKSDFINMKEQIILDIGTLEVILNKLWKKPIEDLKRLFKDKNPILLGKYNIVPE
jgi:hypothetical protein